MKDLVWFLAMYSIDVPALLSFALVAVLAAGPGNRIVASLQRRMIDHWIHAKASDTDRLKELKEAKSKWSNDLDLSFAARIGRIERIFFILGVMLQQYGLISGWIILKAFFAWIPEGEPRSMANYHVYLYGNALSLLIGLACGFAAKPLEVWLRVLIAG